MQNCRHAPLCSEDVVLAGIGCWLLLKAVGERRRDESASTCMHCGARALAHAPPRISPIRPRHSHRPACCVPAEYARLVQLLKQVVDSVDVKEPWKTPGAAELDAITFQTWCGCNGARPVDHAAGCPRPVWER